MFAMIAWAAIVVFVVPSFVGAAADTFPVFASIKPNVDFWKTVYATYSSTQGIIHDNQNLDTIYDVIKLKHSEQPGARKINRTRIKRAKNKYKSILIHLSQGKRPSTPEETRVAALFKTKAEPSTFRNAARNIRCQIGQKDRFRKGIIRSGAYLKKIKQILQQSGLPVDLAYLPHVESSFNPKAYSKFGAAGIWQFTRGTGKRFMTIDYTVDERRDPILSTRAAVKLLKENYEKLGDWPLAITAYNHGANGMMRAKKLRGDYEAIFRNYKGRRFRFASRNFYSEFIAALEIAKNYQRYFGELRLDKPEATSVMKLPGFVAVKNLIETLGIDIEDIRRFNPALREPIYRGEKYIPKGFHVRLPQPGGKKLASIPSHMIHSKQKRSRFYRVRRGDTAGKIARMHNVGLRDLIRVNRLNRRATIYVGQYLRLPAFGESALILASAEPVKISKKPKAVSQKPDPALKPKITPVATAEELLAPPGTGSKGKNEGDGAPALKQKEGISVAETPAKVDPTVVNEDLGIKKITAKNGKDVGIIQVVVEETLGHYAEWLNIPAREIRRLNGFRYGRLLRINQNLKIPLHKVSKEAFEGKRLEYHKEIVEDFFSSYKVETVKIHYIKKGENIWTLCRDVFEVPLWLIQKYNTALDFNNLRMSQPVQVPVVEKITSGY
jgi:membrane-bound lytic murein transglycosylase D